MKQFKYELWFHENYNLLLLLDYSKPNKPSAHMSMKLPHSTWIAQGTRPRDFNRELSKASGWMLVESYDPETEFRQAQFDKLKVKARAALLTIYPNMPEIQLESISSDIAEAAVDDLYAGGKQ